MEKQNVQIPLWMSVTSVAIGFLLLVVFLFEGNSSIVSLPEHFQRMIISAAIGLILGGLGSRAKGRVGQFTFVGSAALVLGIYLVLWKTSVPPSPETHRICRVTGIPADIQMIQATAEDHEHLYGYLRRLDKEFKVRIEDNHLDSGCLRFEFEMEKDSQPGITKVTVQTLKNMEKAIDKDSMLHLEYSTQIENNREIPVLKNVHTGGTVSTQYCKVNRSELGGLSWLTRWFLNLLGFVKQVHAQETDISHEALVDFLGDNNSWLRYEAQRILSTRSPNVIPLILEELEARKDFPQEWKYVASGLVGVMSEMSNRDVRPEEIRAQFSSSEVQILAKILLHPDSRTRYHAYINLIYLEDDRANTFLMDILRNPGLDQERKFYAARALANVYPTLDQTQQQQLRQEARKLRAFDERALNLVDRLEQQDPLVSGTVGWTYVGINFGDSADTWEERYFNWEGDQATPREGDVLTATGAVHVRSDHIKYDEQAETWVNAEVVGFVHPGDQIRVNAVRKIENGYYWVEINPLSVDH